MEQVLPWGFGSLCLIVVIIVFIYWGRKLSVPKLVKTSGDAPKQISLQVPENVNLLEMSNEEIEALALDFAKKAAEGIPKDSTILGIENVTLTNNPDIGVGVWGQWSRSCGKSDLPGGVVVDPEIFQAPRIKDYQAKPGSSKMIIDNKGTKIKK